VDSQLFHATRSAISRQFRLRKKFKKSSGMARQHEKKPSLGGEGGLFCLQRPLQKPPVNAK